MFQLEGHDKLLYIMSYSFIRNLKTRRGKNAQVRTQQGSFILLFIITKTDDEREKGKE